VYVDHGVLTAVCVWLSMCVSVCVSTHDAQAFHLRYIVLNHLRRLTMLCSIGNLYLVRAHAHPHTYTHAHTHACTHTTHSSKGLLLPIGNPPDPSPPRHLSLPTHTLTPPTPHPPPTLHQVPMWVQGLGDWAAVGWSTSHLPTSLLCILGAHGCLIFGGIVYALHLPERFAPGKFDMVRECVGACMRVCRV
jgi:hypothetical protein